MRVISERLPAPSGQPKGGGAPVRQVLQFGEARPDATTLAVNLIGAVVFGALFYVDQRAAGARVERRTQVRPRTPRVCSRQAVIDLQKSPSATVVVLLEAYLNSARLRSPFAPEWGVLGEQACLPAPLLQRCAPPCLLRRATEACSLSEAACSFVGLCCGCPMLRPCSARPIASGLCRCRRLARRPVAALCGRSMAAGCCSG